MAMIMQHSLAQNLKNELMCDRWNFVQDECRFLMSFPQGVQRELFPTKLQPFSSSSVPCRGQSVKNGHEPWSFICQKSHERATSPLFQASAFAFRSFPLLLRLPLAFAPPGNKRHHHPPLYFHDGFRKGRG